ncbi:11924_t:CDS:1, partial [Racocetra persica]
KELSEFDLRNSVNGSTVNASQLEFTEQQFDKELSDSFNPISESNHIQLDEINDDDLLIEEIIDLSNLAFIGNNDSFIEEQSKVSNNMARWSASGNHDYNPARLVAQIFNEKE